MLSLNRLQLVQSSRPGGGIGRRRGLKRPGVLCEELEQLSALQLVAESAFDATEQAWGEDWGVSQCSSSSGTQGNTAELAATNVLQHHQYLDSTRRWHRGRLSRTGLSGSAEIYSLTRRGASRPKRFLLRCAWRCFPRRARHLAIAVGLRQYIISAAIFACFNV